MKYAPSNDALALTDRLVDRICDEFEATFASSQRPTLESYLCRVPESNRGQLFRELLFLDIAYRSERGNPPQPGEYCLRFPLFQRDIEEVFAQNERLPPPFPGSHLRNWAAKVIANEPTSEPRNRIADGYSRADHGSGLGSRFASQRFAGIYDDRSQASECPRLLGDYEILELIGQGGMGTVYRARQRSADRIVAIKVIRQDRIAGLGTDKSREWLERFRREAKVAARVQRDDVATVYDVGEVDGRHFYSMRYVDGTSLAHLIGDGPLDNRRAALCLERVARAVEAVHAVGIVHRDITPKNIIVDGRDYPCLTDFGLAKWADDRDSVTQPGGPLGTPKYMAPEQVNSSKNISTATDIYGLGACLYEALTSRAPFATADVVETLHQVVTTEPVAPRQLNAAIERDLELICLKCLRKEPERRYRSAGELADELRRFLNGEPLRHTRRVGSLERLVRWSRRNPVVASLGMGIAFLLSLIVVLSTVYLIHRYRSGTELARLSAHWALDWGLDLCERGECDRGMLWLARALEVAPPNADDLHWVIRANLAGWQSRLSCLQQFFVPKGAVKSLAYGPDGPRAFTISDDGKAEIWDVRNGSRIGAPLERADGIIRAVFSGDGRILVTATKDGTVRAWHVNEGKWIGPAFQHPGLIYALACSSDGTRIVTAGGDKTARIWTTATGRMVGRPLDHGGSVQTVAISPDDGVVATGSEDSSAGLWELATGKRIGRLLPHDGPVITLAFSSDGEQLITGSNGRIARIWYTRSAEPAGPALPHDGSVSAVAFSPDGSFAITGSADRKARLWAVAGGKEIGTPLLHEGEVVLVRFSFDGRTFMTSGSDGVVRVWKTASRTLLGSPLRHSGPVRKLAFSPDGRMIVTAGADKAIRLWTLPTEYPLVASVPHDGRVSAVAYSPDGRRTFSADLEGTVRISNTITGKPLLPPLRHAAGVTSIAVSPGSDSLLTGGEDGFVHVWNIRTGELRLPPVLHGSWIYAVAFSPDGKRFLSAGDGSAKLWDSHTGALMSVLPHGGPVRAAAFSPSGDKLLTGGADGTAQCWDTTTGAPVGPRLTHRDTVVAVAFSADGRTFATASTDNTAQVCDVTTGQRMGPPLLHHAALSGVAFSPDGRTLATCGADKTAQLWNWAAGESVGPTLQHQGVVHAIAYSPTGRVIATASADGSACLWDTTLCKRIGPRLPHLSEVVRIAFDPNGTSVITGSSDQTASTWDVPVPGPGATLQIMKWIEVRSGLETLQTGSFRELDANSWQERKAQLSDLGGSPSGWR
jgi:WD40 repeat protein/tRNA A-37 threonylcarbamoyl transferase component Bud32